MRTRSGRPARRAGRRGAGDGALKRSRPRPTDRAPADLVSRGLAAGADAVVEKPLTIDAAGCRTITGAVAATGRDVVMTFNYRYAPRNSSLKEVIASGAIGTVTSVHFEWALDTVHG